MKKQITIFAILFYLLSKIPAYSQVTFGYRTGSGTKMGYFGYKLNNHFLPYFSIQMQKHRLDHNLFQKKEVLKEVIILPTIGSKFYFKNNGKIKPFMDLSALTPLFYNKPKNEIDLVGIKLKKPKIFEFELSMGTEYFLDPQFSVGGEFGGGLIFARNLNDLNNYNVSEFYTSFLDMDTEYNNTKFVTYGGISINFYFNKKD